MIFNKKKVYEEEIVENSYCESDELGDALEEENNQYVEAYEEEDSSDGEYEEEYTTDEEYEDGLEEVYERNNQEENAFKSEGNYNDSESAGLFNYTIADFDFKTVRFGGYDKDEVLAVIQGFITTFEKEKRNYDRKIEDLKAKIDRMSILMKEKEDEILLGKDVVSEYVENRDTISKLLVESTIRAEKIITEARNEAKEILDNANEKANEIRIKCTEEIKEERTNAKLEIEREKSKNIEESESLLRGTKLKVDEIMKNGKEKYSEISEKLKVYKESIKGFKDNFALIEREIDELLNKL